MENLPYFQNILKILSNFSRKFGHKFRNTHLRRFGEGAPEDADKVFGKLVQVGKLVNTNFDCLLKNLVTFVRIL